MAPKRPLRIPLHTTGSSRFLANSNSSQSPLLRLTSRLVSPAQRRPLALIILALALGYFVYSRPFAASSSSSYPGLPPRRRKPARRPESAAAAGGAHPPSSGQSRLGSESSLTAYLDARWGNPPAGVEHLYDAPKEELALFPAWSSPHLWLTIWAGRDGERGTARLHTAVERLNEQRKLGHSGELVVGDQHEKQVYPPRPQQGRQQQQAGKGLVKAQGGAVHGKRETRLVVVCGADARCEEECKREGWWCYTGYNTRGKEPDDVRTLKMDILIETSRKRDIFFVDSSAKLVEDPYPVLEPLMVDYSFILQDPPSRQSDVAGHFGTAFYWFRRGRQAPDKLYEAYKMTWRGEYNYSTIDTLAFNHALDSASRVQPLDEQDGQAQAALPRRARKRPLARAFGPFNQYYVLPANAAVVEDDRAWRIEKGPKPTFGKRPQLVEDEDEDPPAADLDDIDDAEVEADAQLQRELAELDLDFEDEMVHLDQESEAAALGEIDADDAQAMMADAQGDKKMTRLGDKPAPNRMRFEDEEEGSHLQQAAQGAEADEGQTEGEENEGEQEEEQEEEQEDEEVLEPDEFPEDEQAEAELRGDGDGDDDDDEAREQHVHKQIDFGEDG